MLKKIILFFFITIFFGSKAQEINSLYKTKKSSATNDTLFIEKNSINPNYFEILDENNQTINPLFYTINFKKGFIKFSEKYQKTTDSVYIKYLQLPDFLTKEYSIYDKSRVVANDNGQNLYQTENNSTKKVTPFDGLNTSGSITRGITVGNNQNAVVNSNLDLQLSGKLSDKISLKASIQDSNLPLRNGGYSQKIGEFDQIFIEILAKTWNIRAGDLFLENRKSAFLNFNKKVQGLFTNFTFGEPENKTTVFSSAAIVRGKYAKSNFIGQEGNQGPYKLRGENNELYILIIPGSERVFINGILKKNGEKEDYIIDYNAGEIKFNTQFAITSEMRIVIEYQYTDQNYTRYVGYAGVRHESKKWQIEGAIYSENDAKNQPIQQVLSADKAQILSQAGDNISLMNASSAYQDVYSTNKILYKKTNLSGNEIFEYSNNATDILYAVRFSLMGANLGNYVLKNNSAIGKIYEYKPQIAGVLQGNFEPIIRLIAPSEIQMASVFGKYLPSEKTNIAFEMSLSNQDKNLFSNLNDGDNHGLAAKINYKQRLYTNAWTVDSFTDIQFIHKNFTTIERLFAIEFNRDWNLTSFDATTATNQSYITTGLDFNLAKNGKIAYQFENLSFAETFSGNRHKVDAKFHINKLSFQNTGSYLKSDGNYSKTSFIRNQFQSRFDHKKNWVGGSINLENNEEKIKKTNELSGLSQKYTEYGAFIGRGDSTKVFVEIGFHKRTNDSLQNGLLKRVNNSNSFYTNARIIKNNTNELTLFANYRSLIFENSILKNVSTALSSCGCQNALNSKIYHKGRFFEDLIQSTLIFETTSGSIAQQEFTYLEVAAGMGIYLWKDYNKNGIQELQEFEISPFPDQAKYVKVFLPNQVFIKTHQNRFSESLVLNPTIWQNKFGLKKFLSQFYNQTTYLIEQKELRTADTFNFNPFKNSDALLGLISNFKNSLFYNRGKQKHSMIYNFIKTDSKNLLSVGNIENKLFSHQLYYEHLVQKIWLLSLDTQTVQNATATENFESRTFDIATFKIAPKISYLFNQEARWELYYEIQSKKNILAIETLKQNRLGTSFSFSNIKKMSVSGEFSLYENAFVGNELTPAAFQMLEGLQPGKNMVWQFLLQKNLTQYLQININYQGRKSETSQTIHTGTVQLRANF